MCMAMRGVAKLGAITTSTCFRGSFERDDHRRLEFLVSARSSEGGDGSGGGGACLGLGPEETPGKEKESTV